MKKIFYSSLISLLLMAISFVASAQITQIDVTNKNSVCTSGGVYTYPVIATGRNYITIKSVTISPSNVGTIVSADLNNIVVRWNDGIVGTSATIKISYIVLNKEQYVFNITSDPISARYPKITSLTGRADIPCNQTGSEYYQITTDAVTGIYWTPPSEWLDITHDTRMDIREFSYPLSKAGSMSVTVENKTCNIAQTTKQLQIQRTPQALTTKSPATLTSFINQLNTCEINAVPNAVSYDWSVLRKVGNSFYQVPEKYYTKNVNGTIAQYTFAEDGHYQIVARYITDQYCMNSCTFNIYVNCVTVYNFPACTIPGLTNDFNSTQGFVNNSTTPRLLADLNNDNRDDIIGFHASGVFVAFSNKNIDYSYFSPKCVVNNFGTASGWTNMNAMPRYIADANGDGYLDIVGFFQYGVAVSLNNGDMTFTQPQIWYVYDENVQLNSLDAFPRNIVDMNHDGAADIVVFGLNGVYIAYSNKGYNKYQKAIKVCSEYGSQTYPSQGVNPRIVADINNDTWPDLVCVEPSGVSAMLNKNGVFDNYGKITLTSSAFGSNQGFGDLNSSPRFFVDMNNDKFKDIVGFSNGLVFVSINKKDNTFQDADIWTAGYGVFQDQTNIAKNFDNAFYKPIAIGDLDGDGYADIIGFNDNFTVVSKNMAGQKFDCPEYIYGSGVNAGTKQLITGIANIIYYPSQDAAPRYLANLDGDARKDIVAFNQFGVTRGSCYPNPLLRTASDDVTPITEVDPVKAYPNPAADNFNIEINYLPLEENIYKVLIYDINGSLVSQKDGTVTKDNNAILLDLSNTATGLYFYKVYLNNEVLHTDKLIIE